MDEIEKYKIEDLSMLFVHSVPDRKYTFAGWNKNDELLVKIYRNYVNQFHLENEMRAALKVMCSYREAGRRLEFARITETGTEIITDIKDADIKKYFAESAESIVQRLDNYATGYAATKLLLSARRSGMFTEGPYKIYVSRYERE